jgi:hypothetical protein
MIQLPESANAARHAAAQRAQKFLYNWIYDGFCCGAVESA